MLQEWLVLRLAILSTTPTLQKKMLMQPSCSFLHFKCSLQSLWKTEKLTELPEDNLKWLFLIRFSKTKWKLRSARYVKLTKKWFTETWSSMASMNFWDSRISIFSTAILTNPESTSSKGTFNFSCCSSIPSARISARSHTSTTSWPSPATLNSIHL